MNKHRILILANGFFPFPVSLNKIAEVYESFGYEVRVVPFDIANMKDTKKYALFIAKMIKKAYSDSNMGVDVIGISMGGIATYYAVKHHNIHNIVRTCAAVGSPFHGSPLGYIGVITPLFSLTGEQLSPGSKFLKALRDPAGLPDGPRYMSFGGLNDFICPFWSIVHIKAENYFADFGHHDTIWSKWVHELILMKITNKGSNP